MMPLRLTVPALALTLLLASASRPPEPVADAASCALGRSDGASGIGLSKDFSARTAHPKPGGVSGLLRQHGGPAGGVGRGANDPAAGAT